MAVDACGNQPSRYPKVLTKADAKVFKQLLPYAGKMCAIWRGGGFDDEFRTFFEGLQGQFYRVAGFLATSLARSKAMDFIERAEKKKPRILWCILVRLEICRHHHQLSALEKCITCIGTHP